MLIPVRACYKRSKKGEKPRPPQMISAEYAEVPDELVLGTLAQAGLERALLAGDTEAAGIISRAIDKATADGKLMTM